VFEKRRICARVIETTSEYNHLSNEITGSDWNGNANECFMHKFVSRKRGHFQISANREERGSYTCR
jgi:hypothetical protein